ncbi:DUF6519 domain-containing protein [Nitrosomonas sp. Nm166]|uniref:DUF6519 domain-containing protein n=1 Tax=Nitrosomonas sp. Nm166 TaxID=1881054 RepID=UPI0008EBD1B3|nr:DUF6519 domain-containing protein [Nitrosomonas sp. Nm166]SFE86159.1 hypothetical protein SAMN05428977_103334 [Nitrosomonas sp. Nm166]
MKGDFSRDTFDPSKHFSRVLQQQGRVLLDADTNEQTAILLHYLRTLVTDLIGPYAGPEGDDLGFGISQGSDSDNKNFSIGKGRYYVKGILCENDADITYQNQEDYPNPPDLDPERTYLIYLDVWERHITALEDDYIREKALGGPDTASRTKVIWQVKIDDGKENETSSNEVNIPDRCSELMKHEAWDKWVNRWQPTKRGLLKARIKRPEGSTDPCLTAPDAKYRGQENQLYRIEIHKGGTVGKGPTFKWSRDNGSVACKVLKQLSATEWMVEKVIGFESGIWIELSNDEQELRGEPGTLVKLTKVEGDRFTLELAVNRPDNISATEKWPTKARRWDQHEIKNPKHRNEIDKLDGEIPVTEGQDDKGWIEIENGIEIQFMKDTKDTEDEHFYRSGDYWLIPARVATGDIEWPVKIDEQGKPELELETDNKIPLPQEPLGIQHYYAPLAILRPGNNDVVEPCRCEFRPLNSCNQL